MCIMSAEAWLGSGLGDQCTRTWSSLAERIFGHPWCSSSGICCVDCSVLVEASNPGLPLLFLHYSDKGIGPNEFTIKWSHYPEKKSINNVWIFIMVTINFMTALSVRFLVISLVSLCKRIPFLYNLHFLFCVSLSTDCLRPSAVAARRRSPQQSLWCVP